MYFVAKVVKAPACHRKVHVVLAPLVDTYVSLSARIVAALMGGFSATPQEFLTRSPRGIMYEEKYRSSKKSFHVAISPALAKELPSLPEILRAISTAPGSCFKFYLSPIKLRKFSKARKAQAKAKAKAQAKDKAKAKGKAAPQMQPTAFVLSKQADLDSVEKKYKDLYILPRKFILMFDASERAICPGCRPT